MNSDDVRGDGDDTLLNIELDGLWRRVTLTREAIEEHLHITHEAAGKMSEHERCDFARGHLPYVFAAVRRRLRERPDARRITLRSGQL
jgi:hypothetical protein